MKVKVKVPTSLSDIKLSQYQKFVRTTEGKEDENFINRQMVAIFCNIPDDAIGYIKKSDYDEMVTQVRNVLSMQSTLQTIINFNGVEYGFIPDNFENITVSELADIDSYIKDVRTYDKAMAVLYRPISFKKGKQYLIEDYKGEGQSLDLPMSVVSGALVFFSDLINDLLSCTQNSIMEAVKTDKRLQTLVENGVGINHFTDLLRETFSDLKMSVS